MELNVCAILRILPDVNVDALILDRVHSPGRKVFAAKVYAGITGDLMHEAIKCMKPCNWALGLKDTVADICVYLRSIFQRPCKKVRFELLAANGTPITTYGITQPQPSTGFPGLPVALKPRRIVPDKLNIAQKEFNTIIQLGCCVHQIVRGRNLCIWDLKS